MSGALRSALTLATLGLIVVVATLWGWSAFTEPFPEDEPVPICENATVAAGSEVRRDQVVVSVFNGAVCGFAGAWLMRRVALPSSVLSPLAVMCLAFLAYGAAAAVHASGFAAIYVAALILGNSELPHRVATRSFAEGVAWLAQIGLFVMLGLLLSPGRIDLDTVVDALVT